MKLLVLIARVITFLRYGIAAIAPFSDRLTFDNVPTDIQLLRCKVNFLALEFVPHIRELGDALIGRLKSQSDGIYLREMTDSNVKSTGKFVALHLRFDKVFRPSQVQLWSKLLLE